MANKTDILDRIDRIENKALSAVKNAFPLSVGGYTINAENLRISRPKLFDLNNELIIKDDEGTLRGSIKGVLVVKEKDTGKTVSRSASRDLMFIPYLTNRGTYIVGGMEKVIVKQMRLKPGVYTYDKDSKVESLMFLQKGKNLYLNFDPETLNLTIKIGGYLYNMITFLRILGISDSEISQAIGDSKISEQLFNKAQSKRQDAETQKLWSRLPAVSKSSSSYPGVSKASEDIQRYFFSTSEFGETGSKVMRSTLGYFTNSPDKQVFLLTLSKIINIAKADTEDKKAALSDDRDDIRFQDVLADEDQIEYFVRVGIEELEREMTQRLRNNPERDVLSLYTVSKASRPINSFMSKGQYKGTGSLVDLVEQTNPLLMSSAHRKITSLGEGGLTAQSANQETRNLQNSAFGKLDPVETPESGKIGLVSHLTRNSTVSNLTIKSKYYKVKNGSFVKKDSNIVELKPLEEYGQYIAFSDPNTTKGAGDKITLPDEVWARYQGNMVKVSRDKVDLIDLSPHVIWGDATNLIPFSAHNDGNRMLMGANMQKQALPLVNRAAPLVQNAIDPSKGTTYEELIAKEQSFLVESDVAGTVEKVTDNQIVIKDRLGKKHTHELMNYFPLNMSHYIKNEPLVSPGDKVSKGQLLADGWQTKEGKLALGINARVAYMPWKGFNFEDGYVVSESFAKKMTTEELKEIVVDISADEIGGPGSNVKDILAQLNVPKSSLDKLDENGIIRVGEEVGSNTILVGIAKEDTSLEDLPEFKVLKLLGTEVQRQYEDKSEVITGYISGKVTRVNILPRGPGSHTVKITVLMQEPLKEGDKIAGRHGNKGIITKIERDTDMPRAEDGEPLDILYSPLGVPSRKNLGQLYEANAGLVASKKGAPFKVFNFDKSEADEVKKGLKEIGFPDGKMTLFDPETGKPYENKTTVGVAYIMKLHHKVDEKLQARGMGKAVNYLYNSPSKMIGVRAGEKENPQKFGEMEMRALEAAKAVHFIDESTHLKADGAGDKLKRRKIFDALAFGGLNSIERTAPTSLHIFKDYTSAMGLNVKPMYSTWELKSLDDNFNSLSIAPYKPEVIKKFSKGEVTESKFKSSYVKGDKPDKGGLMDPEIFGETPEEQRNYWGHINLGMPLPNPILLTSNVNPYSALLGINKSQIDRILKDKVVVVTKPGDTGLGRYEVISIDKATELEEEGANFEYEIGGKALEEMLKTINVDRELISTQQELVEAKPKDRAKHYKKLRILNMLKENDMKPSDLMIKTLPVLPVGLRPFERTADNRQIVDSMNHLYKNLIQVNNKIKDVSEPNTWYVTHPHTKYELAKDAYDKLEAVMGANTTPSLMIGNQPAKGVLYKMKDKDGLIRGRLMSKFNDYSGRSVITVNPSLNLDEAGIPVDMAATLYKPFVMRELYVSQSAKNPTEALEKASNPNDPDTVKALEKVIAQRPVVLNRQPSLHKYSIQAFTPKLTKARAIELNPLIVKGFNADFDGDQMGVHIPLTSEAVNEAKTLLTPSHNLINPTNGSLITPIQGEAILGIYYLTIDKHDGKQKSKAAVKKDFSGYDNLLQAYKSGEVATYDIIDFKGVKATVGQHLVNDILPANYRDYDRVLNGKILTQLIETMINEEADSGGKATSGPQTAVMVLNRLKDLGFLAATKSALSISVFDLKESKDKNKLIQEAEKRVKNNPDELVPAFFDVDEALREKIQTDLGLDNPVAMFMASGAKGNVTQTNRMANIVGLSQDITGSIRKEMAIKSSFKEGLSPQEMWVHAFDSRRGLADRALSTSEPGALTRRVWNSTQDAIITIADCGDMQGIFLNIKDSSIVGRYVAQSVRDKDGTIILQRNKLIGVPEKDKLQNVKDLVGIYVRSPMSCKAVNGICQKCYGTMPGTNKLPMIGEPVGILASQAIGEPTAQGVMRTFHAGGASKPGAQSGFARVNEIFNISENPKHASVLSPVDGRVLSVMREITNTVIVLEYEENNRRRTRNITVPLTKSVLVKAGDIISKGQRLTEADGALNPKEILEYKGIDDARDYLVTELSTALAGNNINRKHMELAIGKLTDKVEVDRSSTSGWLPGQVIPRNQAERWNQLNTGKKQKVSINDVVKLSGSKAARTYKGIGGQIIVNKGDEITVDVIGKLMAARVKTVDVVPATVSYTPTMFGVIPNPTRGNENWFSQMGHQNIKEPLAEGAAFGKTDILSDPRGRQMAGKLINIGSGFSKWKEEFKSLRDKIGGSIAGLFD